MLHGTSIAGPVPISYFGGIGLLTLLGTLQLHNLTGNAAASSVTNGTKDIPTDIPYGRMICHDAYFSCSKSTATLLPSIPEFSEKSIVCHGDDSYKCGRLDDKKWTFTDAYVNGLNLGRQINKSFV